MSEEVNETQRDNKTTYRSLRKSKSQLLISSDKTQEREKEKKNKCPQTDKRKHMNKKRRRKKKKLIS